MRKVLRKNKSLRHYLQAAIACATLFVGINVVTSCSGYGAEYTDEKKYSDWFDDEESSSSYAKSSSSSYGKSSSSSNKSSSSSSRYSSSSAYSSSSNYTDTTTVKTVTDLADSCSDGEEKTVSADSSIYRCVYSTWFKILKNIPDCTKKNEAETFYKNDPYVCINSNWRVISEIEAKLGVCTKALSGTTKSTDNKNYVCDSTKWRLTTISEVKGECTSAKNGTTASYNDTNFICRGTTWQKLTQIEQDSGVCSKDRFGEVLRVKPLYSNRDTTYYKCDEYEWTTTTAAEDIIGKCDSTKTADSIYIVSSVKYVCDNGTWRAPTSMEISYGFCNAKNQDSIKKSGSTKYICDKGTWRITNAEEYYGTCTDALQDTTYSYDSKLYACINKKWTVLPEPPLSTLTYCTKKNQGSKTKTTSPKAYYICDNYQWQKIDSLSYTIGMCNKDSVGVRKSNYECRDKSGTYQWVKLTIAEQLGAECTALNDGELIQGYVCDSTKWRLQTTREKNIGETCSHSKIGTRADYAGESYTCQAKGWVSATEEMNSMGACSDEGRILKNTSMTKVCYLGNWVQLKNITIDTTRDCMKDSTIGLYNDMIYFCPWALNKWRAVGPVGMEVGYACTQKNTGKTVLSKDSIYYTCRKSGSFDSYWDTKQLREILGGCSGERTVDVVGQKYKCTGENIWTPIYGEMTDSRGKSKSYKTLKVGKQLWIAENLNYESANSWCYNNQSDNCDEFGRLYTWNNISDACPTGWHVPSVNDFWTYTQHPLSPSITSNVSWQEGAPTSSYSSAYPRIEGLEIKAAGMMNASGGFEFINRVGGMWFSDESAAGNVYVEAYGYSNNQSWTSNTPSDQFTTIGSGDKHPSAFRVSKSYAFPIRCVKDLK